MSGLKHTQELKALQTRLTVAKTELEAAREETRAAQKKEASCQSAVREIQNKIETLQASTKEPIVSEHAFLRYFERVKGYDLNVVRNEILNEKVKEWIQEYQSGKFPADGFRVVVSKGTIVTIET